MKKTLKQDNKRKSEDVPENEQIAKKNKQPEKKNVNKPKSLPSKKKKEKKQDSSSFNINTIMGCAFLANAPVNLLKDTAWSAENTSSLEETNKARIEVDQVHYVDIFTHEIMYHVKKDDHNIITSANLMFYKDAIPAFKKGIYK